MAVHAHRVNFHQADREHRLYDWRERTPCEVAIQAASAGLGGVSRH